MRPDIQLTHEFVEFIPADLKERTVYVSIEYATATHRCCCGCGAKVVTPLTPTDWSLIFDGETISLDPSIGNWSYPCRSHYWIAKNRVQWAPQWSNETIRRGRAFDRFAKERHFSQGERPQSTSVEDDPVAKDASFQSVNCWSRVRRWLHSRLGGRG